MITIYDLWLAFCAGAAVGVTGIITFVWAISAGQRRQNRRP